MNFKIYRSNEADLIQGCRRRDSSAQRQIYNQFSSRMFGVCYRYVKDSMEAEDVLVTSFMKVFDRIDQYKGEGSFEGWIRRIVVNEALTYLRKNRMMHLTTELEEARHLPDYNKLETNLETDDLLAMIERLPPGYRVVFNMYAIDGYSHKEIADELGISENTSKSQLSRARTHLQKMLSDYEYANNQLNADGSAT